MADLDGNAVPDVVAAVWLDDGVAVLLPEPRGAVQLLAGVVLLGMLLLRRRFRRPIRH